MARAGLTADLVTAEAARVADEAGYDRLTLSALAERFGVAVPSLYKHVGGLDDLRRRLALLALRELGLALAEATPAPAGARSRLRALALAYRDFARAHPGRYAATLRAPDPDDAEMNAAAQAVLDTVFDVLAAYDIEGDRAIDAARAARSALHGFVALETAGGFGMPRDLERSYEWLVDALHDALSAASEPRAGSRSA